VDSKTNGHEMAMAANPFTATVQEANGTQILDKVSSFIRRYVHLSDDQARITAVWTAHTYAIRAATTTPYLSINSAVKQSGKTRLLEVFELLVSKPWLTGRVTTACLIRKVDSGPANTLAGRIRRRLQWRERVCGSTPRNSKYWFLRRWGGVLLRRPGREH
jgi:hypothetical protein